jgi:putative CocE/NonD family hydrolase
MKPNSQDTAGVRAMGRKHRIGALLGSLACAVGALAIAPAFGGPAAAAENVGIKYPGMVASHNVRIPMRDGVTVSALIFRPDDNAQHPTIFEQTPYGKDNRNSLDSAWSFVKRGYAVVTVDVRGRHDSDGVFRTFRDAPDGSDAMDWIVKQPWSNGKIATAGASYGGNSQWNLWRERNPNHTAIMSYVAPANGFSDFVRFNGVPKLDLIFTWMMGNYGRINHPLEGWNWNEVMHGLPLDTLDRATGRNVPDWGDFMRHQSLDDFWMPLEATGGRAGLDIPTLSVTGWYDGQLLGQVRNHLNAQARGAKPEDHVLIIGPWPHSVNRVRKLGDLDLGDKAVIDLDQLRDAWVDHVMLGGPAPSHDRFVYFLPAKNEWRQAKAFPIPGTKFTEYRLSSRGKANTAKGDGVLTPGVGSGPPDGYQYDPAKPVPSLSSRTAGSRGGIKQGSVDYSSVEARSDVLVYTGAPLTEGMEITGPVAATIYLSTDVVDTDIVVRLVDVYPDGRALNIAEGIARAKYRNSLSKPELLTPGKVEKVKVELFPTSNYFAAGHRLRVEVTSSDFPVFARNLNTENSDTGTAMKVANTKIYHSKTYPSAIALPIVPAGASTPFHPPLQSLQPAAGSAPETGS